MTDWIEHTGDTCPVDPETVVEVRLRGGMVRPADEARATPWGRFLVGAGSPQKHPLDVTHYRIITPAKPAWLDDPDPGADPAKPSEPEMTKPEPDLVALRLECLKLAVGVVEKSWFTELTLADTYLHYVLNGSVDKA